MTAATPANIHNELLSKRLFWLTVFIWGVVSYFLGTQLAQGMNWRINDLAAVPGAGVVERDSEGVYYLVQSNGRASAIFTPKREDSEPSTLALNGQCLDCTLVTGDQLAQTNEFCAAGTLKELPRIHFEIPCRSWAPISEGPKVVSVVLFIVPILVIPMLLALLRAARNIRRNAGNKPAPARG